MHLQWIRDRGCSLHTPSQRNVPITLPEGHHKRSRAPLGRSLPLWNPRCSSLHSLSVRRFPVPRSVQNSVGILGSSPLCVPSQFSARSASLGGSIRRVFLRRFAGRPVRTLATQHGARRWLGAFSVCFRALPLPPVSLSMASPLPLCL